MSLMEDLAEDHGRLGGVGFSGTSHHEAQFSQSLGTKRGRTWGGRGLVKIYIEEKEWNLHRVLTLEPKRSKGL